MGAAAASYTIEDQRRMARAANYFAWQARLVRRELGHRVVEVGCGIGNFTNHILDRELVIGLDVEPSCVELLRDRYPHDSYSNVHCLTRDVGRDPLHDLARFRPDSCLFINVLEHIEDDFKAIRDAATILTPGGTVILFVPAFQTLFGSIDRNLGHYRRYDRRMIRGLASAAGLKVEKQAYFNLIGFFGWWANSHVFKREAQSGGQIDVFDRYLVPVMERAEALLSPPFGQSIFAVLRKPIS
jgi:SAM-dependent methyltransferase